MDGRLAPYLSRNQSLHRAVARRTDDPDYLPAWRPSLGLTLRNRLKAAIAAIDELTRRPSSPQAGPEVPGPVHPGR